MSSPSQVEHILSPASSQDTHMTSTPPLPSSSLDRAAVKGEAKLKWSPSGHVDPSVFNVLNIFRRRWFLSRAHLMANTISAQKAEDGNISWVEFSPQYHSHLVKCAVALVPHPVLMVKKVMFVYILELLNREGHMAFFELQKGGRKANKAQMEKRRLARKRSRAAKREREREAAKAAKLPPRERQCQGCGRKFASRKKARKHKCPKSKVARIREEAAEEKVSQPPLPAQPDKPPATLTPHAPTPPPNNDSLPAVTRDLQDNSLSIWVRLGSPQLKEMVACECGEIPQTVEHVLLECPQYHTQRTKHLTVHGRPQTLAWLFAHPLHSIGLLRFLKETWACATPRATWEPG